MVLAFLLSCVVMALPVVAGMAVVRHSGVDISGPRGTPLSDDMPYVRWDEGAMGVVVRSARSVHRQLTEHRNQFPDHAFDPAVAITVWEIEQE
jgi:hypothetical protein